MQTVFAIPTQGQEQAAKRIAGGLSLGFRLRTDGPMTLAELAHHHGDFINFSIGRRNIFLINSPAMAKHIFENKENKYGKSQSTRKVKDFLGNGLLTAEGELWKQHRRIVAQSFTTARLQGFVDHMVDATEELLAEWAGRRDPQEPLDVQAEMMRLTLSIASRSLFSSDIKDKFDLLRESFTIALEYTVRRINRVVDFPLSIPTPGNRRFLAAKENLDQLVYALIAERRQNPKAESLDLLDMLIEAKDAETQTQLTDTQIRDEILTMILGGYDTAANTLAWAWSLLSQHPHVAEKLAAEADAVLAQARPAAECIGHLEYARAVFNETMRLYPPVWVLARQCLADDRFEGYFIPKGAMLLISPYVIHHDPRLWKNPQAFQPERFLADEKQAKNDFHFFPFGGGPRQCMGMRFAMMEGPLILALMARKFQLELVPWHRLEMAPSITLGVKGGLPMLVQQR